ncbi:MAG: tRNA dihydrouridine synthase, partial [Verrucomicrobiota bacterium]
APMQDVTDLAFMGVIAAFGTPDYFFTEFLRVHSQSRPERHILRSIDENATGRPVFAQLIGEDIFHLERTVRDLLRHPIAGIDLNLGCPAPVVYRKCAGGGLLREPARLGGLLGALREAVGARGVKFTVKTRLGFAAPEEFEGLLPLFARAGLDLLTVHGRTVLEMYRTEVHYDWIARAVAGMPCPVLANGNVHSADRAQEVLRATGARGLMIGWGCIRSPWLFGQIRARLAGLPETRPRGREVLAYVEELYDTTTPPALARERLQVEKMKKYMNFLGTGLAGRGDFLHRIRRATHRAEFFAICRDHLDHDQPMPLEGSLADPPKAAPPGSTGGWKPA